MFKNVIFVSVVWIFGVAAPWGKSVLPDIRDGYGVAIADFDGDGLADIYLVGFRSLNRMLVNNGDGSFRDKSIAAGVGGNLMPQGIRNLELGASAADFDNDGAVDILICGWGESLDLLKNRGDGTFYSVAKRVGLARDADANMGVWGDLDGDGYLDLLLTNEQGPMRLYRNDHGTRLVAMPVAAAGITADSGSQGALWADLDLDGDLDLAVAGWRHPLRIYEQTSPFHFKEIAAGLTFAPGTRCNAVLPGDIDNDGDPDLLVTLRGGVNALLINRADPPRTASAPADWRIAPKSIRFEGEGAAVARGLGDTSDFYGGAFGDFDGDGDQDLLLTARGPLAYYRNEGGAFTRRDLSEAGVDEQGAAYRTGFQFADLTPSPGEEMVIVSRDSACSLQDGPAPARRRLKVVLRGVQSNANGVGAWISLWKKGSAKAAGASGASATAGADRWELTQSWQVHGGSGYLGSYVGPQPVYPEGGGVEQRVRVRFPGGKTALRRVNPGDSVLEVWEGGFFAAAWEFGGRSIHAGLRDPERRKAVVFVFLGAASIVFLLRFTLKVMARNIARKQYQRQLIQSEKLAALGQLVAGIAHELNNPIGFIYANLHQIQKYLDGLDRKSLDAPSREALAKIDEALRESREGSTRVRDIVQNLRGLSRAGDARPDAGPRKRACDINQLLDKSLLLAQTNFSKNIAVEKDFGTLPPVDADETQLQQVFLNILVNACQALGEKGTLRLRTRAEGGKAAISVADDGPGIGADHLKRIFDPFFTTKPVGQGIGLGLHICHQIVAAHGGAIEARSVPGQGAEFLVTLPLHAS